MVRFRLIPRDPEFFGDFAALADELREGARLLGEMFAPDHPVWDKASEIEEIERKCDSHPWHHRAAETHPRDGHRP